MSLATDLPDRLFPRLDPILADIPAATEGLIYTDPDLVTCQPLQEVLDEHTNQSAVVVVSDAGAARGHRYLSRLLNTIAFFKQLREHTTRYVWLNPLPSARWKGSTAEQIARHIPMFCMDRDGMNQAVNILRGQPYVLEKPI